jgi:hypothetical protein
VSSRSTSAGLELFKNANRELKLPQSMFPADTKYAEEIIMLWTICVILIVLWLLGLVTSYTMGGLIHILLVIAIIVVLVRVIQGRKVL